MVQKIEPGDIKLKFKPIKFKTIARQVKKRNNYFTIPKAFVDNDLIEIGKEYEISIKELEEKEEK